MPDTERLRELIESVLDREGFELFDLELSGSRARPVLRVYADLESGITIDECARLSRLLEGELESAAAVPERYVLEVSSPGLDRPLKKRGHFEQYVGEQVEVRLYAARDGRKRFIGPLLRVVWHEDGSYSIVVGDPDHASSPGWTFDEKQIAGARLHPGW